MIDFYFWPTPNGYKVLQFLFETKIPYRLIPVDISKGDQFKAAFLKVSPNNKMPAIVDHNPIKGDESLAIFESGAILLYLAEKTGRFIVDDIKQRAEVLQWLFWQAGGLGPMAGQLSHFVNYTAEDIPYARQRYENEYDRLLAVMDVRLRDREFLAGEYSIADIASFPWVIPYKGLGNDLDRFSNLRRWFDAMKQRPAVRKGTDVGSDWKRDERASAAAKSVMFGQDSQTVFDAANRTEK